jgi:hypothetical protein
MYVPKGQMITNCTYSNSRLTELYHVQHVMVEHPAQYHVIRPTQDVSFSRVSSSEVM